MDEAQDRPDFAEQDLIGAEGGPARARPFPFPANNNENNMASKEITQTELVVQLPTISITPNDLREAFLKWEKAWRLGDQKKPEEKSAERAAEVAAGTLWNYLVTE